MISLVACFTSTDELHERIYAPYGGYRRVGTVRLVPAFIRGLTVASVGLIFGANVSIGQRTLTGWASLALFAAALAIAQLLRWNPLVVLAASSLLGVGVRALGWS